MPSTDASPPIDSRESRIRILDAAAALIRANGADAATTRAVSLAAAVQAPAIYRLFGDKEGLLNAVAERELAAYIARKPARQLPADPVDAIRQGWDDHVRFGLAHPALFTLMCQRPHSPAAEAGLRILAMRVHAIAAAGRLTTQESRAVQMIHAACVGAILSLLADGDDPALSAAMREAVLAAITTKATKDTGEGANITTVATTLRALVGSSDALTAGEHALMDELLVRLGNG